jgi:CelD/BcsL family acetyltransferase involved in cellulose biosynthesis
VRVAVCRPRELGLAEIALWHAFQKADIRLRHPFLTPAFAMIADGVRSDVRVAVIEEQGSPIGFWAFSAGPDGSARPVLPGYSDRQGIVHGPGCEWDWKRLLGACGLSGCQFDHLPQHQTTEAVVGVRTASSRFMDLREGWPTYVNWIGHTHKGFFAGVRRKERRMRRDFQVGYRDHDPRPAALATLMQLKSAQCRQRGWRDVFGPPWVRQAVEQLAAAQGPALSARVSTLLLDGEVAVAMMSLRSWTVQALWFSTFRTCFAPLSPGIAGVLRVGSAAEAAGVQCLDLGKGEEPYKQILGNGAWPLTSGWVMGGGSAGRAFSRSRLPLRIGEGVFQRAPATERRVRNVVYGLRRVRTAYGDTGATRWAALRVGRS